MTLNECRDAIDALDDNLLELLTKRMEVVQEVGRIKHKDGSAIYRPEREQQILERLNSQSKGVLTDSAIEAIFLEIFAAARNMERPERVACLGPEGSFTHQAAESRFGALCDYLPMESIHSVFKAVEAKRAKFAVVPIENNTDGIVGETLDLLAKSELKIVAELSMAIHLSFVTSASNLSEVKKIYSKDKAFGQCREFLYDHGLADVEMIPVESTAKAAKIAYEEEGSAAICSSIAAKLYKVPILFENIEDVHSNRTRFIILSDFKNEPNKNTKTSILVKIAHADKAGSLVNFLQDFEHENINLSKIESRPNKGSNKFDYMFYIDFDGHIEDEAVQKVFKNHSHEITWLGSYIKA